MSAFILSENHIDALVNFARRQRIRVVWQGAVYDAYEQDGAAAIGKELMRANYESVNYRYNESQKPEGYHPVRLLRCQALYSG